MWGSLPRPFAMARATDQLQEGIVVALHHIPLKNLHQIPDADVWVSHLPPHTQ